MLSKQAHKPIINYEKLNRSRFFGNPHTTDLRC